ncbi:MAG: sialate O-acetylesterase [Lentisphaerae bacterium]|jgi:sialate O-acetylesterase|nr:sialate O-acetylesterase [Lentisphaerota bacterium]
MSLTIVSGLFDHMVLQRNRADRSEAAIAGRTSAQGTVLATVRAKGRKLKGFDRRRIGSAARGRFSAVLKGLPVGGPYEIELAAGGESLRVSDVLVGDVWLLGGQSNMQGCGFLTQPRLPVDEAVRAFYMDDRWAPAADPIHNMWACVDPVHITLCGGVRPAKPSPDWGACPGPAFGLEMRRQTGVPQGLVACAHGGTSMTQWDPVKRKLGGASLYGALVRRLVKNGGRVAGVLWYQGCSDANPANAPLYTPRMQRLCAALRRDCRDPRLPIVIVQIGRVIGWGAGNAAPWNSIQEQQRRLPGVVRDLLTVPVIDLPLDDNIHISGESQTVLGRRLAEAVQTMRKAPKALPAPISLGKIAVEHERGRTVIVAAFDNVVGRLRAGSRPGGFAIAALGSADNHYDIRLDGRQARIYTGQTEEALSGAELHYGHGTNPYCNITDEAGRSLPVFGPVTIGVPRAITPFIQTLRVSAFQPGAGKLGALRFPAALKSLGFRTRSFPTNFCDLHPEIAKLNDDAVVYYACRFTCPSAMRLALLLGYDGPVKAWVDGREVAHDPDGVNPATPSKCAAPFKAAAGEHELVVALGTNHSAAWGIFLRIERLGIPLSRLVRRPETIALPAVLG